MCKSYGTSVESEKTKKIKQFIYRIGLTKTWIFDKC